MKRSNMMRRFKGSFHDAVVAVICMVVLIGGIMLIVSGVFAFILPGVR